jgi:hypothetical protein
MQITLNYRERQKQKVFVWLFVNGICQRKFFINDANSFL